MSTWETEARRLALYGGETLWTEERRVVDDGYICGFDPILYLYRCPCGSDLSDLAGQKKVAATTAIVTA